MMMKKMKSDHYEHSKKMMSRCGRAWCDEYDWNDDCHWMRTWPAPVMEVIHLGNEHSVVLFQTCHCEHENELVVEDAEGRQSRTLIESPDGHYVRLTDDSLQCGDREEKVHCCTSAEHCSCRAVSRLACTPADLLTALGDALGASCTLECLD